jgi:hypothetical protein
MTTIEALTQELTELKAARTRILTGGQSYAAEGRTLTRADLATLDRMIRQTEARIDMAKNNGQLSHATTVFGSSR